VDSITTDLSSFLPRSIKQRKDQKGGSAFGPSNETTHVCCVLKLSFSLPFLQQQIAVGAIQSPTTSFATEHSRPSIAPPAPRRPIILVSPYHRNIALRIPWACGAAGDDTPYRLLNRR
jgi:hypothetical protein